MNSRSYNKLHINKNREEGSEKLILGYQHDGREITFKKDQKTYFHVGVFSSPLLLTDSNLVESGATGGPFPAISDRIFKNKKNFGNVTANGTPSDIADGTYYCSWLYKSNNGMFQWLDRFYNPNNISHTSSQHLFQAPSFQTNTSVFRDLPSTLEFESGVMYEYFHVGNNTARTIVNSFAGLSSELLMLDLSNWGDSNPDASINNHSIKIKTDTPLEMLYSNLSGIESYAEKRIINFDRDYNTKITTAFDSDFNSTTEFTVSCWLYCESWDTHHTTQLFGNHTTKGGYGVFIESLFSYPFFAMVETFYGHLLFINEDGNGFHDKSIQIAPKVNIGGSFCLIDENQHVVVCPKDNTGLIYKLDHLGKLIASSKTTDIPFEYIDFSDEPLEVLSGPNYTTIVRTKSMLYTFDMHLNNIGQLPQASTEQDKMCFLWDSIEDTYELTTVRNSIDAKSVETTMWSISAGDFNLYRKTANHNYELFYVFADKATSFSIDPWNRIWVLHGVNNLTVVDSNNIPLSQPLFTQQIKSIEETSDFNKISFFCNYDKIQNTHNWRAVVYYSDHYFLYIFDMDTRLFKTVNLTSLISPSIALTLDQELNLIKFAGDGDFTGYEYRRVFNNISPCKNKNRLVLKTSVKDGARNDLVFKQFIEKYPIENWENDSWQHMALVYKNRVFSLFVNGMLMLEISLGGRYALSYELQPLFFVGSSGGSQSGLNEEVRRVAQMFVGKIGDIKIYNYALDRSKFDILLKSFWTSNDIFWVIPSPLTHYVEKIERLFKNKIPGSKSAMYRINIRGSKISDDNTKQIIEDHINELSQQIQPGHTDFIKINWID